MPPFCQHISLLFLFYCIYAFFRFTELHAYCTNTWSTAADQQFSKGAFPVANNTGILSPSDAFHA